MKRREVPRVWNFTDARQAIAGRTNDSLATEMSGLYSKHDEGAAENGPIASACSVVPLAVGCDGCGMRKTMCGPRSIRSSRSVGFMSTPARKHGTNLGCTQKVSMSTTLAAVNDELIIAGWGKKMSYCIAFSNEGATDVTRRYVRNATDHGADRNRAPEEVLLWIMNEIRRMRRENLSKEERRRLIAEDDREEKELRGYVVQALAAEIGRMLPTRPPASGDEQKLPARRSGAAVWREARGENGPASDAPDPSPPREGH